MITVVRHAGARRCPACLRYRQPRRAAGTYKVISTKIAVYRSPWRGAGGEA